MSSCCWSHLGEVGFDHLRHVATIALYPATILLRWSSTSRMYSPSPGADVRRSLEHGKWVDCGGCCDLAGDSTIRFEPAVGYLLTGKKRPPASSIELVGLPTQKG